MKHFYEERKQGFEAAWQIPFLARGTPKQWQSEEPAIQSQGFSEVSMDFKPQMDTYRRCLRAVKYQLLFICMTFAILWLFEVLFRLRIHPIQYLLTGVSLCVFYLLLLSLAEHIAFFVAYAVAAMAVVGQVALYSKTMLGGGRRAVPGARLRAFDNGNTIAA